MKQTINFSQYGIFYVQDENGVAVEAPWINDNMNKYIVAAENFINNPGEQTGYAAKDALEKMFVLLGIGL